MTNINESNIFAIKGREYHKLLLLRSKRNLIVEKGEEAVFSVLDSLSMAKGFHLGLQLADAERRRIGDISRLYVYGKDNVKNWDIMSRIYVKETPMGAWQAYLFQTSPTQLPWTWHGGYIVRRYVFHETDLSNISLLKDFKLTDLPNPDIIYPSVDTEATPDGLVAHVYCCFWNQWVGLVREHIKMEMYKGKIVSYEEIAEDRLILYEYDCGILF